MTIRRWGKRALILGGSLAGLLAARVLSRHFDKVLIVERDSIIGDAQSRQSSPRKGVPQGRHAHALLPCGGGI